MVEAGITSVTALRALGAVAAYRQLKHAAPHETTLVALYAIQGALMDCPWTELPTAMREELREARLRRTRSQRNGRYVPSRHNASVPARPGRRPLSSSFLTPQQPFPAPLARPSRLRADLAYPYVLCGAESGERQALKGTE